MGASHSDIENEDLFKQFKREDWVKSKDLGLYQLWQNTKTGQLCEAYKLEYVPQQEDLEHYRFRHYNQNADNFVQIRYVDVQKNRTLCYHGLSYVLTQFIPIKLTEMYDLTPNEGYSILRAAYRAFHTMQAFHGPFIPDEDLIGVNINGRPKIWLNSNHSKNKADSVIKAEIWQKHMGEVSENVKRIFQMVEQRIKGKRFPHDFRECFFQSVMNFSQASEYVEEYCEQYRISIPLVIQYTHFIEDADIVKIINEFVAKRPLHDKMNTLESTYGHDKFLVKNDDSRMLRRNQSHQNFTYHRDVRFVRSPQHFGVSNQQQQNRVFAPFQQSRVLSNLPIQGQNVTHQIVIPPQVSQSPSVHGIQNRPIMINPQIMTLPDQSLRSTVSVFPIPTSQHYPTRVPSQPSYQPNYQNMATPQHINGNFTTFVAPNKIAEFHLPVRNPPSQTQQTPQNKPLEKQSEGMKSGSIHEKIKDVEVDQLNYFNDQEPEHGRLVESYPEQPLQSELKGYINDNSGEDSERYEREQQENLTSEPDWDNMQYQQQQEQLQRQQYQQQQLYQQYQQQQQQQQNNELNNFQQSYRQERLQQKQQDEEERQNLEYLDQADAYENTNKPTEENFYYHGINVHNSQENDLCQEQQQRQLEQQQQYQQQQLYQQQQYQQEQQAQRQREYYEYLYQQQQVEEYRQQQQLRQMQQQQEQQQQQQQQQYEEYEYEQNNDEFPREQQQFEQQQQQNHHNTQTQHEKPHHQPREYIPVHHHQHSNDISPIKENTRKNIEEFSNHYAMFSKYAQGDQNHPQHQDNPSGSGSRREGLEEHEEQSGEVGNVTNSFQPRNVDLNQSQTMSNEEGEENEGNRENGRLHEEENAHYDDRINMLSPQDIRPDEPSITNQSSPDLESSQRMRHLSSKNTSINRGTHGQSSGTLIVHQSKQNLYQNINNEERAYQLNHNRIEQDSREESVGEEYEGNDGEEQGEQYEGREYQKQEWQRYNGNGERREQNVDAKMDMQGLLESGKFGKQSDDENGRIEAGVQQDRNNQYEEYQGEDIPQYSSHYHQQQASRNSHNQDQQQNEEQRQTPILPQESLMPNQSNQYQSLHFRNQSDQLYQYTPVDSVYKVVTGENIYGSFSRPKHPSGVEQIVQLQKHEDIQEYIRNKYSKIIGTNSSTQAPVRKAVGIQQVPKQKPLPRQRSSKDYSARAMTFAKPMDHPRDQEEEIQTEQYNYEEKTSLPKQKMFDVQRIESQYEKIENFGTSNIEKRNSDVNQSNADGNDFLDVGNLQKSLDQKYKNLTKQTNARGASPKNAYNIKGSQTMSEEDGMNVAALEQKLQKFEERQSIEREKSQRKIETINDQSSVTNHNELNFNELDNIVEMMDRKIQESQKKQKSGQDLRQGHYVSDFVQRSGSIDPLDNVQLETSINNINNNKQISLKDIPILYKDQASNASGSIPTSKRDYYRNYGMDSQDFATGRGSSSNDYQILTKKQSNNNNRAASKKYETKYDNLSPVIEIDRKYENYSSKNISTHEYEVPSIKVGSEYGTTEMKRKSSRRSTKNVDEAKRLADQISSKYDKYMGGNDTPSNYEIDRPFAKKSYTQVVDSYNTYKDQDYKYSDSSKAISPSPNYGSDGIKPSSNTTRAPGRDIQRKRSSYLNTILELQGQNYASPYKEETPYQPNQENHLKLSNMNSNGDSRSNRSNQEGKSNRNSKVSYDQLRNLLWK